MKSRWDNGLRAVALLGLLFGARSLPAQEKPLEVKGTPASQVVLDLRVVGTDGSVLVARPAGLPVEVGKSLQPEQVAASIRLLYQTGDYADLQAISYPEPGGVRLDFVAKENVFINQIIIEGLTPPPTDSSASAAMQLSLGQTYHAPDIQDAVTRLKDALWEEGLYQAKISTENRITADTHQLDLIVHVDSGPRVRLSKVDLLNNTEFTDGELLSLFKVKAGRELTIARVQAGEERIRKYLKKKGHLSARVSARRGEFSLTENTIPLTVEVTEGPRVLVEVLGANLSRSEVK